MENKKVWLIVIDDHRADPEYLIRSTEEKAQKAMREIIEDNYMSADEQWYDCYDRTLDECIDQLSFSNGEDYVHAIEIGVDNPTAVH